MTASRLTEDTLCHSLQTPAPALYPQSTLALAAIYLSSRLATPQIALPLTPVPWWTLFDTNEDEILDVCTMLLKLYADWGSGLDSSTRQDTTTIWRRAGSLPLDKRAVRNRIAATAASAENGSAAGGKGTRQSLSDTSPVGHDGARLAAS